MSKHPIVHVEFPANNPKADSKFYADVFDWGIITAPDFDYTMFQAEERVRAGFRVDGFIEGLRVNRDVDGFSVAVQVPRNPTLAAELIQIAFLVLLSQVPGFHF